MANTRLAQKISQQPGVGLVSISGGQRPAVRVQINPRALAAYGLNIDDLRTTLGNANVNTPKGNFDGPAQATTINANDQISDPQQYLDLVIAYRNGAPVHLKDVATVVNGAENTKLGAWANTTPAVILNVQRQPGANVIQVVDTIKALLPQLQATLPAAVDVAVLTDRTVTIRASVADVEFELGAGRRAGRRGDLPVPAQPAGDDHPQPVGAAVAGRHAGGDVSARASAWTICR